MNSHKAFHDRATLHPLSVLLNPSSAQPNDVVSLWARGAVRIDQPTASEIRALKQEHQRMEKNQSMVRRGMLVLVACASLLWCVQSFAQESVAPRTVGKVVKTDAKKSTSKNKNVAVSGDAQAMIEAAKSGSFPAPIRTMVAKGNKVNVLDVFEGPGGLVGFVLSASNAQSRIYYVTQDGSTAIYGLAFDAQLNNMTSQHIATYTNALRPSAGVGTLAPEAIASPLPSAPVATKQSKDELWSVPVGAAPAPAAGPAAQGAQNPNKVDMTLPLSMAMKARGAFVEGRGLPVYIVFDPGCPYCHKTYRDTRSLLGQMEIHWIPVGALGPRSILLAETFVRSKDKAQAMQWASNNELKPAEFATPEVNQLLSENAAILTTANVANVPLILFSDRAIARHMVGAPTPAQLKELSRVAAANR